MAVVQTLRQDTGNYVEGLTWGQGIAIGMGKLNWLQNGLTVTEHMLNESGQIIIPTFKEGTPGAVTDLCATGDPGTVNGTPETLLLDKNVTGVFDGCFTVAGIAQRDWQRSLNNAKLKQMSRNFVKYVEAQMIADGTQSTQTIGSLSALAYLNKLKGEYFAINEEFPTVALVSVEFHDKLTEERAQLGTAGADFSYINGSVARVAGLEIIVTTTGADVVLLNSMGVNLAYASTINQIPNAGIIGSAEMSNLSFSGGMISKHEIIANAIGDRTWVHLPFGVHIIPEFVIVANMV